MPEIVVDKNLEVKTKINAPDIKFYNVKDEPFNIYGIYNPKTEDGFKRMPDEIGKNVSPGVSVLYLNSAGGRIRFCTDSEYVAVHATYKMLKRYPHMSILGTAGMDLFIDAPDGTSSRFKGSFVPPVDSTDSYESLLKVGGKKLRCFTINLPSYSSLDTLYIGLQKDAYVGEGLKYRNKRPIVYYGSSITQGACALRPGNAYQNMVSRALSLDFVNLGFSGGAKGEDLIVDYMSGLDMSVFVSDYDHNAPNATHLFETGKKMYDKIREKHPYIPYILMSRPDFCVNDEDSIKRRNSIIDIFRYAKEKGDNNVYYIDGEGIFKGRYEDCCTVDGTHPNDLGFMYMADSVESMLRKIMIKTDILN